MQRWPLGLLSVASVRLVIFRLAAQLDSMRFQLFLRHRQIWHQTDHMIVNSCRVTTETGRQHTAAEWQLQLSVSTQLRMRQQHVPHVLPSPMCTCLSQEAHKVSDVCVGDV